MKTAPRKGRKEGKEGRKEEAGLLVPSRVFSANAKIAPGHVNN